MTAVISDTNRSCYLLTYLLTGTRVTDIETGNDRRHLAAWENRRRTRGCWRAWTDFRRRRTGRCTDEGRTTRTDWSAPERTATDSRPRTPPTCRSRPPYISDIFVRQNAMKKFIKLTRRSQVLSLNSYLSFGWTVIKEIYKIWTPRPRNYTRSMASLPYNLVNC